MKATVECGLSWGGKALYNSHPLPSRYRADVLGPHPCPVLSFVSRMQPLYSYGPSGWSEVAYCTCKYGHGKEPERIHEIIDSIPLQYKRSLKKVNRLRIRYEPRFRKPLQIGSHFSSSATETFIDSPTFPQYKYTEPSSSTKSLSIQCNRIGHEAVRNKHRLAFTQDILPGSPGRLAHPAMNDTRLAIKNNNTCHPYA